MPFSPKLLQRSIVRPTGLARVYVIKLAGLEMIPDLSGALYLPDQQTLIIADLHLEQGTSLARRGLHVPPFDTQSSLDLLDAVVSANNPQRLIFLGDSFHDQEGSSRLDEMHREKLKSITNTVETFWISGNHDPAAPHDLGGTHAEEIALGSITLRHKPAELEEGKYEISGHLHPGCTIVQRGRSIRGKCFVADERRLIMPAFGAYTGALSVTGRAFDGLFKHDATQSWMIGKAAMHRFPHSRLS